jgi:predicted dithiol-disulfide oxidoreductase (DUF899 family)
LEKNKVKIETMKPKTDKTYNFLDLVPKGRDENPNSTMDWVRRHDEY